MFYTYGPLRDMERAMQQPPNYKKGGGFTVLHTSQKLQDLVCVNPVQNSGSCTYKSLITRFLQELQIDSLTRRIVKTIQEGNEGHDMLFRDAAHKQRFAALRKEQTVGVLAKPPFMAALFLLASDQFLWSRAKSAIHSDRIDFSAIDIRGITMESYAVYQTARDLYYGTQHITLADLTDPELVNDSLLRLLINSFLVRRHGLGALGVKV